MPFRRPPTNFDKRVGWHFSCSLAREAQQMIYRRGKYHFFSYGNCEINFPLVGGGDFKDYERYLHQLLE